MNAPRDPRTLQCNFEDVPDKSWCGSSLCADQGCIGTGSVRGRGRGASGKVPPPGAGSLAGRPNIPMFPGERKRYPVFTGLLAYFPDACAEVARCSLLANEQHNPGERMHWARAKSVGEGDELVRHLMQCGTLDSDGVPHTAKVAWRALELLQREIEGGLYDLENR